MSSFNYKASVKQFFVFGLIFLLSVIPVFSQTRSRKISGGGKSSVKTGITASKTKGFKKSDREQTGDKVGVPWTGESGVNQTTDEIMQAQSVAPPSSRPLIVPERERESFQDRPQDPAAKAVSSIPANKSFKSKSSKQGESLSSILAPQPVGLSFDTITGPTETGAFPPDTMGAIGPAQFVVFVNGRLRTFNKTTGAADGVINVDPDVFFSSVLTPVPSGGINFTSDPNVRYDRLSGRWFLTIIDIPSSTTSTIGDTANRILIAVSDAASTGVISAGTVWTFYFVQQDTVGGIPSTGEFLDYPSLGIDANALYVGGDMFGAASGAFINTTAFVIRKSSVLSGGPIVTTAFRSLIGTDGPLQPRGVDNYDAAATEGYFIGVSSAAFSRLIMRRIATPGGTPTISANISITVPTTTSAINVDHLGNTGGTSGRADGLDDRLYTAHIRNGRLWTAHSFTTGATGVASTGAARRMSVRWYELIVPPTTGTPTINQSGTVFDTTPTQALARQYWLPSIMVSGQGHVAMGYSTAGTPFRIDAATNGRLSGNPSGTTGAVSIYTTSSNAYNPPGDPGPPRRWGDYSFTSLDPLDDMTMWTIQEYTNGTNTYGARVAKLTAPPPPASATSAPTTVSSNNPSTNIVVTGTAVAGSGFYDPGTDLAAPALPFNHISASGVGIIVNSITYNSPTQVTLNVSSVGSTTGLKTITITNPDGQSTSTTVLILGPTAGSAEISGRVMTSARRGIRNAVVTVSGGNLTEPRYTRTGTFGNFKLVDLQVGETYVITVSAKRFVFQASSQVVNLTEDFGGLNFISR